MNEPSEPTPAPKQTDETAALIRAGDDGVSDPAAIAAHDRMAKIGSSDGSLYTVESVYGPSS